MRRLMEWKRLGGFALLVMLCTAVPQPALSEDVSVGGDIGVVSQYVWRGVTQTSGKPAVQGDVTLGMGGLSASMWFSNAYPSPQPQFAGRDVVEFDWTLDYSGSIADIRYSLGGIYYTYFYDSHSNFAEVYLGLSYDATIHPSVAIYYTVAGPDSAFYKPGDLWVDFALRTGFAGFDGSAGLSYAHWKGDPINRPVVAGVNKYKNGISVLTLSVSKSIETKPVTWTPSMTVTI